MTRLNLLRSKFWEEIKDLDFIDLFELKENGKFKLVNTCVYDVVPGCSCGERALYYRLRLDSKKFGCIDYSIDFFCEVCYESEKLRSGFRL